MKKAKKSNKSANRKPEGKNKSIQKLFSSANTKTGILVASFVLVAVVGAYAGVNSLIAGQETIIGTLKKNYYTSSYVEEEEEIDFIEEHYDNDQYDVGVTVVEREGAKGKRIKKYEIISVDGKEVKKKLISEEVAIEPENRIVAVGTRNNQGISNNSSNSSSGSVSNNGRSNNGHTGNGANAGSANTGGSQSGGSSSQSNDNANWLPYNASTMISLCEKSAKQKYGYGFYPNSGRVRMGDTGNYIVSAFVYRGSSVNSGFTGVSCSFKGDLSGSTPRFNSNSSGAYDNAAGYVYNEQQVIEALGRW